MVSHNRFSLFSLLLEQNTKEQYIQMTKRSSIYIQAISSWLDNTSILKYQQAVYLHQLKIIRTHSSDYFLGMKIQHSKLKSKLEFDYKIILLIIANKKNHATSTHTTNKRGLIIYFFCIIFSKYSIKYV